MRSHIIDCFDSNLQERILKINEKLKTLSPDNFRKIDSSVVELNSKLDALNYQYAGDSMINSVDVHKLNGMIVRSRSRIMKFSAEARINIQADPAPVPLQQFLSDSYGDLVEISIDVPESFSGLRSFVVCHPSPEGRETIAPDIKKKFWYYRQEKTIKFNFLRYTVAEIYVLFWK